MGKIVLLKRHGGIYYIADRERLPTEISGKYQDKITYLKSLGRIPRGEAEEEIEEWKRKCQRPFPKGLYDVIYADPLWKYDFSKSKSRAIESHSPTMSLKYGVTP